MYNQQWNQNNISNTIYQIQESKVRLNMEDCFASLAKQNVLNGLHVVKCSFPQRK